MSNCRCNLLKPTPRFLKRIIPRNWNSNAKINQRPKYWPTILNNQWYNYLQLLYFGGDWVQFGHDNSDKVCRKRTVILFTIDLLLPVNWSYANWQGWICELACTCNVTLRPFSLRSEPFTHQAEWVGYMPHCNGRPEWWQVIRKIYGCRHNRTL